MNEEFPEETVNIPTDTTEPAVSAKISGPWNAQDYLTNKTTCIEYIKAASEENIPGFFEQAIEDVLGAVMKAGADFKIDE